MEDQNKNSAPNVASKRPHWESLDSMEGLIKAEQEENTGSLFDGSRIKALAPGIGVAAMAGLAAAFLSEHYGGPVMLFALLLGLPFFFLSQEGPCVEGIQFSSRTILRLGVALLGARITADQVVSLGAGPVILVIVAITITVLSGVVLAHFLGLKRQFGLLSGGAVAICGASAALALSAVMPKSEEHERNTILTVVAVTTLSTVAMVLYPLITDGMQFSDRLAGIFLGGTIHDVAQVVGAGYTISNEAGDTSTIVKLFRVAMLLPVVLIFTVIFRRETSGTDNSRPPLLPAFLIAFAILVAVNSFGIIPKVATDFLSDASRWCLVTAIAALGMKTSFRQLLAVGWQPVAMMVGETLVLASFFLIALFFLN